MMRWIGFIGVLLSAAAAAQGQTSDMQCAALVGPSPIVRQEGVTELVADLLVICTGGTPTPVGQTIPQVSMKLTLNTAVTSKLLPNGGSEALLLIDDPLGSSNPRTRQVACTNVMTGCPVQGTGGAANPFTLPGNPNIFEGRQTSANVIEWDGVPFEPPSGDAASRVFRLTNIRANANQAGVSGTAIPPQIVGLISLSGSPGNIVLSNPQQILASVQPALTIAAIPSSLQQCPAVNGGNIYNPNPAGHGAVFHLLVKEQSPNALKRHNLASSLDHPDAAGAQNVPGQMLPYVESGFIPDPSSGLPAGVGTVNFGSVIQLSVSGLPSGVSIQVPAVMPLKAAGAQAGSVVTRTSGGVTVGSDVQFTPALGSGLAVLYLDVVDTVNFTTPFKVLDLPVALIGQASTLPAHIQAAASFASVPNPQTTLFAADSPNAPPRPIFQPATSTGIAGSSDPFVVGASVTDCNNKTGSLLPFNASSVNFTEYAGLPAPTSYTLGVVSDGSAVPDVVVSTDALATWLHVSLNQTTTPITATFSVDPSISPSSLATNVIFTSASVAGAMLKVPVSFVVSAGPAFTRYGIGNLGSYVNAAIAPGEPFVLFGSNEFGPPAVAGAVLDAAGLVATTLGNTQVLFDSTPAPLAYAVDANGIGQIAGFAPFGLVGKSQTQIQVVYNSVASPAVAVPVLDAVPGLFTADQSGGGQGAILNQDGTVNGYSNPEAVGNVVTLYGGGAGQTTPPGRDGAFAGVGAGLSKLNLAVKVFVDGILASDVPYAGPAPQMEEGLFQIDVRIPQGVHRPGNLAVSVQVGDKVTQPGVTVAVR